ncbi:hypothetical protein TSUD_351900 [Trifolium subterraneum]|uniref:TIR domain-containing protein n=1 Tax=Trifolium subterraneum TaxID=3900 RepID=A0A2Z6P793_TRISU|nr:hypothetical protein TSUD_351900 [Trifolium subterraneum]
MSSSSSTPQRIYDYDVFLSFRGEDTRRDFVAHLYHALSNNAINTYHDNLLEKGTVLEPELMLAIQGSRMSIVVFSENYAESSWCLKELGKIMECNRNDGQVVLPVFKDVDPTVVRHQTGGFGRALGETASRRPSGGEMRENRLSIWKQDLKEAANISGWTTKVYGTEVVVISQIVEDVLRKLKSRQLNIAEFPIGLDPRVKQVIKFIENQTSNVCLIGIWGMGGSGKTTTAKAIYNQIHLQWKFVDLIFIENIKDICNKGEGGVIHLQEQLKGKRALIVLDDVSTYDQVKGICLNRNYFARGSVLIVTSRDVRILQLLEVDHVYSIKEMDEKMSLELFSWHAFRQSSPTKDFRQLSEKIVACCGGLPLALEAIGSSLRKRTNEKYFENALSELRSSNGTVQKSLIRSYDGLESDCQRDIFLDICCFFIGEDIACVTEILNGCGFSADTKITDLIERSLLKVEKNNKLEMHDFLRDMGRAIVDRLAKKPGERSRLWFDEDGTKTVKGLVWKSQSNNNVSFKADSFREMKKLRLLQLDDVDLTGDYVHLSQELRWLRWQGFTRDCIPNEFYQKNLVVFELTRSNVKQFWSETKCDLQLMEKLKILNLSRSKYLENTPDFSKLPYLEKLIMEDCPRLSKIDKLEEGIMQMESLTTLAINDTGVKEVPYSVALTTNGLSNFFLPSGNHPSCLAYTGAGPSTPFQVPKDFDCRLEEIVLRVIYSPISENTVDECLTSVLIVNYTKCTIHIYKRDTITSFNDEDWKSVTSNLGPGDNVKICVAFGHGLIVKKTIAYLISGQSIIVEVDDAKMELEPSKEMIVQLSRKPDRILIRLPNRTYASSIKFHRPSFSVVGL